MVDIGIGKQEELLRRTPWNWTIENGTVEGSIRYIRIGGLCRSLCGHAGVACYIAGIDVYGVDGQSVVPSGDRGWMLRFGRFGDLAGFYEVP